VFSRERRRRYAATLGKRGTMPSQWTGMVHWVGMGPCGLTSETLPAQIMRETSACHRLTSQAIPGRSAPTKSSDLLSRSHPISAAARPLLSNLGRKYADAYSCPPPPHNARDGVGCNERPAHAAPHRVPPGRPSPPTGGEKRRRRQDSKKVIVWPDELAPGKPRFPTPPWRERP